ncbi:hypothetical protein U1Q18_017962 [Sarracenia purpurea var. burkii]
MSPSFSDKEKDRVSPVIGDPQSGSMISLAMDDLQHPAMVMAEAQTPCAPSKDTMAVENVAEKVSRGAITQFQEGISPLSSSLKSGLDMGLSQNVEATLNEEEVNDEDAQVQGEIESFEIKRRSLLRDKALAKKDLQYLDEAQQLLLEKIRKANVKAPLVDEGGPIRTSFIPRSVQFLGGRFQRGGRGGGRAPMGRTWSRVVEEGIESSEGPLVEPQAFDERPK